MNDANGGRGQLQGWIRGVEFNCGGALTETDLWVSQKAPFELLLGRPWQRGNLVSIDERDEGTYLVFKDRATRRPRYELLAVPYPGSATDFQVEGTAQYQAFALFSDRREAQTRRGIGESGEKKGMAIKANEEWNSESARRRSSSYDESGDSPRLPPERPQREMIQLLSEIWRLLAEWLLGAYRAAVGMTQEGGLNIKERTHRPSTQHSKLELAPMNSNQSHTTPLTAPIAAPHAQPALTHTPPMAVPASPAAHYALPFDNQPYENVQYLSRQHFYHPPAVALGQLPPPEEALAAIEGMLREQWEKYRGHQPIDVHPTFSAAPQSRYIGSYTSPGGQLVHRSVAMNNLEVLTDERTGLPYTLAGHTVRDTYSVPAASDAVWPLELFYPSNERLHDEMTRCMKEPPPEGDPGFPVHATPESPPMQAGMPGGRATHINETL
ncbi:hypothetical protein C8R47DRAFT_1231402 [Mycena vitilis]|nr:hypothetical protein C8R47DRAFT_1231402 [Mycena vitilis]